ncbi:hypothetical protein Tco_0830087 [Tanacetum coccineum]
MHLGISNPTISHLKSSLSVFLRSDLGNSIMSSNLCVIARKLSSKFWCTLSHFLRARHNELSFNVDKVPTKALVIHRPVRKIPGPTGIVQAVALRKQADIHKGGEESVMSTQENIRKVDADVVPGNGSGVGRSDVGGSGIGGSGVGGSGMLDEEEIIKLLEE